jgi:polysaccharide biosynthesis protein PslG
MMIRRLSLILLAFLLLASPAAAKAPAFGVGDQHPQMFSDPAFRALGVKHSRYVLEWDWYKRRSTIAATDWWMSAARAAGARPLVAFARNWGRSGRHVLPPVKLYRKSFRTFRARYPWVHDFSAWNEANHTSQPTARNPRAAARYFNAMRSGCRRCRIVAADVLDSGNMLTWTKKFKRYAPKARLWGLHNYKDANDRTNSTRAFLRAVRGKVWLTETGGILHLTPAPRGHGHGRNHTRSHQAAAIARVFKIARSNRRIERVYFYEWRKQPSTRWDSGFLDANGRQRPAYRTLKRNLRHTAS